MLACFTAGVLLAIALMPHIAGGMVAGDGDGDGYTPPADCNDANAEVHPGAIEVAANTIDEDCDGRLGVTRLVALKLTGIKAGDTLQVRCRGRGCRGRIDYTARVSSDHAKLNLSRRERLHVHDAPPAPAADARASLPVAEGAGAATLLRERAG